jgi:pimeloyl-ACP methyl ester carboxylesterase
VANQDSWVRKEELLAVIQRYFPQSTVIEKDGGHLFHEANPEAALAIIESALDLASQSHH